MQFATNSIFIANELVVPKEWLNKVGGEGVLREQFVRSPYAVGFRSEDKTFILVTLHIKYGKSSKERIAELQGIADWMSEWADSMHDYNQNLIALGDFNIDERGDLLDKTFISKGLFVPAALQNQEVTRSIFDKTKYYDQIAWFASNSGRAELSLEFITGGNYDFVGKVFQNREVTKQQLSFMMSDHYPLWAEFAL